MLDRWFQNLGVRLWRRELYRIYNVTSGVTLSIYCRGTSLHDRELSTILDSQFVELIRRSSGHLLFTTNKSKLIPISGAAKFDRRNSVGSQICHTYVVDTSCPFLHQFPNKAGIEKLIYQLHVHTIIQKSLEIRVHRVRVGTYSQFHESGTTLYYKRCTVTVQYITAFSDKP